MKDEANIVEQYADSDVGERIDILIKYYPNFIHLQPIEKRMYCCVGL